MPKPITRTIRSNLPLLKQAFCSLGTRNEKIALFAGAVIAFFYGTKQGKSAALKLGDDKKTQISYINNQGWAQIIKELNNVLSEKTTTQTNGNTVDGSRVFIIRQKNKFTPTTSYSDSDSDSEDKKSKVFSINLPTSFFEKHKPLFEDLKRERFEPDGNDYYILHKNHKTVYLLPTAIRSYHLTLPSTWSYLTDTFCTKSKVIIAAALTFAWVGFTLHGLKNGNTRLVQRCATVGKVVLVGTITFQASFWRHAKLI